MKILITGGTGFIGHKLGRALAEKNHELVLVSRDAAQARERAGFPCEVVEGDLMRAPLAQPVKADAVIHLMGESVAEGRWTDAKKKKMTDSRILATRNLRQSVRGVRIVIASSAVGYYGDRGEEELTEASPPGSDFLARLCADWEHEVRAFAADGARTVSIRTGLVLSKDGGALPALLPLFKLGLGGALGDGRQWMSWIHADDIVGLYLCALENDGMHGAINGTAPHPVRNRQFTEELARVLKRPARLRVPEPALKLALGEKAVIVTASQKAVPRAAVCGAYRFKFSEVSKALAAELR